METKRDFEAKAKASISTNPDEAVKLITNSGKPIPTNLMIGTHTILLKQ